MLNVFYKGTHVGGIRYFNHAFQFKYNPSYLDKPGCIPLSPLIPCERGVVFSGSSVRSFLVNLQPENPAVVKFLRNQFSGEVTAFSIMDFLGGDAPGVFTFSLTKEGVNHRKNGSVELVDESLLKHILSMTQQVGTHSFERVSLAGYQPKTSLGYSAKEGWYIPSGAYPSTHILKPERKNLKGHALLEHLSMETAKKVGVRSAKTKLITLGDSSKVLVIERFDRKVWGPEAGQVKRLHQVDFLQCTGLLPSEKYEKDGGFQVRDFFNVVTSFCPQDLKEAIRLLVFQYEIGNFDNHGKNFSLVWENNGWRLAPGYDMANLSPLQVMHSYAMSVGNSSEPSNIHVDNWYMMAKVLGLDPEWVVNEVKRQRNLVLSSWIKCVDKYRQDNILTLEEERKLQHATAWLENKPKW